MLRAAVTAAVLVYNAWEHFLLPPHTARICICLSGAGTGALELYFVRDGAVTHARPFGVGRGRRGILFQRSSSRGTFIAEHAFDPFADD
jgi:hypothetical protein